MMLGYDRQTNVKTEYDCTEEGEERNEVKF